MKKCMNLHKAKGARNDEFYTLFADISKELVYYSRHFQNKTILCNCDNPEWSNFWKYFHQNFEALGLKKLIATYYDPEKPSYKMEYNGGNDTNYSAGTITPLIQNGDFRSSECIEVLKNADIVVTNPPFSLFRDYIAQLMVYDKKFIAIGSMNAVTCKDIFSLLKNNQMWLGCNSVKEFMQPDGSVKKFGNILWFTNLDIQKRHKALALIRKYTPEEYPKYDNYDAIDVSKVIDIPCDYNGIMGVPITFLDKYNPEQFELLGYTSGRDEFGTLASPSKRYINAVQHNTDGTITSGSKVNTRATILVDNPKGIYYTADNCSGKMEILYVRVLVRRKVGA